MNVFDTMVRDLTRPPSATMQISLDQYLEWRQQFSFDGLCNMRYGQSFCNYFDITDAALFYCRDVQSADQYIFSQYIQSHN